MGLNDTLRTLLKAHVKGHTRVVNGKVVYIHDYDSSKPQGRVAELHERTVIGKHRSGTHFLRATDAEDGAHIQAAADRLGIKTDKRRSGANHHGRVGAYDHLHVENPEHAIAIHNELKKQSGLGAPQMHESGPEGRAPSEESGRASRMTAAANEASGRASGFKTHGHAAAAHRDASEAWGQAGDHERAKQHAEQAAQHESTAKQKRDAAVDMNPKKKGVVLGSEATPAKPTIAESKIAQRKEIDARNPAANYDTHRTAAREATDAANTASLTAQTKEEHAKAVGLHATAQQAHEAAANTTVHEGRKAMHQANSAEHGDMMASHNAWFKSPGGPDATITARAASNLADKYDPSTIAPEDYDKGIAAHDRAAGAHVTAMDHGQHGSRNHHSSMADLHAGDMRKIEALKAKQAEPPKPKTPDELSQAARSATGEAWMTNKGQDTHGPRHSEAAQAHLKAAEAHLQAHAEGKGSHHFHEASNHFDKASSHNATAVGAHWHAEQDSAIADKLGKHAEDHKLEDNFESYDQHSGKRLMAIEAHGRARNAHGAAALEASLKGDKKGEADHSAKADAHFKLIAHHNEEMGKGHKEIKDRATDANESTEYAYKANSSEAHTEAAAAHRHAAKINYDSETRDDHKKQAKQHEGEAKAWKAKEGAEPEHSPAIAQGIKQGNFRHILDKGMMRKAQSWGETKSSSSPVKGTDDEVAALRHIHEKHGAHPVKNPGHDVKDHPGRDGEGVPPTEFIAKAPDGSHHYVNTEGFNNPRYTRHIPDDVAEKAGIKQPKPAEEPVTVKPAEEPKGHAIPAKPTSIPPADGQRPTSVQQLSSQSGTASKQAGDLRNAASGHKHEAKAITASSASQQANIASLQAASGGNHSTAAMKHLQAASRHGEVAEATSGSTKSAHEALAQSHAEHAKGHGAHADEQHAAIGVAKEKLPEAEAKPISKEDRKAVDNWSDRRRGESEDDHFARVPHLKRGGGDDRKESEDAYFDRQHHARKEAMGNETAAPEAAPEAPKAPKAKIAPPLAKDHPARLAHDMAGRGDKVGATIMRRGKKIRTNTHKATKDALLTSQIAESGSNPDHHDMAANAHFEAAQAHEIAWGTKNGGMNYSVHTKANDHHWGALQHHQAKAKELRDAAKGSKGMTTPEKEQYRGGDKIRFTGNTQDLHGGKFHEFEYLEGAKKGQKGVTQHGPNGSGPEPKPQSTHKGPTPQIPALGSKPQGKAEGASQAPASEATSSYMGHKTQFTGNTKTAPTGMKFHEYETMEGPKKGEKRWSIDPPGYKKPEKPNLAPAPKPKAERPTEASAKRHGMEALQHSTDAHTKSLYGSEVSPAARAATVRAHGVSQKAMTPSGLKPQEAHDWAAREHRKAVDAHLKDGNEAGADLHTKAANAHQKAAEHWTPVTQAKEAKERDTKAQAEGFRDHEHKQDVEDLKSALDPSMHGEHRDGYRNRFGYLNPGNNGEMHPHSVSHDKDGTTNVSRGYQDYSAHTPRPGEEDDDWPNANEKEYNAYNQRMQERIPSRLKDRVTTSVQGSEKNWVHPTYTLHPKKK